MDYIDNSNHIKQLITYNNDLGDALSEVAALTDVMIEVDFSNLKSNTQQNFFMLVDGRVTDAVAIQRNMTTLLEQA